MNNKSLILVVTTVSLSIFFVSPTTAQDVSGHWQGSWQSCSNSHRGKLSASFCRIDDTHVQAKFRGTFAKIIPFRYKAVLTVVNEQPGIMQLSGSKRLGPIMGTFRYDATIIGNQFDATYSSKRDHGRWSMRRW